MNRTHLQLQIANAPCSWGVLEFEEQSGYDYSRVLDEMRAAGYDGTELGDWGFMPTDPRQLADALATRSLSLLGRSCRSASRIPAPTTPVKPRPSGPPRCSETPASRAPSSFSPTTSPRALSVRLRPDG